MNDWDLRFLKMASEVGEWSKDPSRKIGCVIVKDRRILATGYNGFPRGIADTEERLNTRELKYKYVVHGEMNAIYNAIQHGVSLNGATLYAVGLPICSECAKGIIQVGIKRVVIPKQDIPTHWQESCEFTKKLFGETGVNYDTI
jgi:dCMP deaminase